MSTSLAPHVHSDVAHAVDPSHTPAPLSGAPIPPSPVALTVPVPTRRDGRQPDTAGRASTESANPAEITGTLKSRRRQRRMAQLAPPSIDPRA
jgi:hypothetical protein